MTAQAFAPPQRERLRAAASARFEPPRTPLLLLLLKGWTLTVLTVGAYRFWAAAESRAFLWRHLSLGGERLEYDGKPSEALARSLVSAAVAVPVLAVILAGLVLLADADAPARVAGIALSVAAAGVLLQIRRYRHRQYLLSHTLWRGIRGGLDGSAMAFAAIAAIGWLATLATLGLAYPVMRSRCWAYQIGRARFGNRHFSFDATAGAPFGAWLLVWLAVVAVLSGFAVLNQEALLAIAESRRAGLPPEPGPPLDLLPLAGLVVPAMLYIRYRVREFRHIAGATSFGRISLKSALPAGSAVLAVLVHWVLALAGVGLAATLLWRAATEAAMQLQPVGLGFPLALAVLVLAHVSIVRSLWLRRRLLRAVCRTMMIGDLSPLRMIEQHEAPSHRGVRRSAAAMATAES